MGLSKNKQLFFSLLSFNLHFQYTFSYKIKAGRCQRSPPHIYTWEFFARLWKFEWK